MNNELIKVYASYFASYLLKWLGSYIKDVNYIILFGSVARGEANKESDVDIFVDIKKEDIILEKRINDIVENFYKSREATDFKLKGVSNKINVLIGRTSEWGELRKSIENNGIILYGHYITSKVEGKKYILFFWDSVKKNRGAFLNKIYGFNANGKRYDGLVNKIGGRKLGKSSILVPVENSNELIVLMKKYVVNAKNIEIYH